MNIVNKIREYFQVIFKNKTILILRICKILIVFVVFIISTIYIQKLIINLRFHENSRGIDQSNNFETTKAKLEKEINQLNRKLDSKTPKSYYLVINSSSNEFFLYKGKQLVKKDKCSTGSYVLLRNGDQQQWMFKTPKGEFRIQSKTTSPVWKKPDWAFVEEGLPVPPANHHTRFEYGVLGDYALNLGHGYLIHGTLFQRFIGLPVTHGCIRLNDENLELIYRSLAVGAKVYIY